MSEKITAGPANLTPEQVAAMTKQPATLPLMYFNYLRTAASFYDARLFLGRGEVAPSGQVTFHEDLCAVISLEFAKTLRDKLSELIQNYEGRFGTIRNEPRAPGTPSAGRDEGAPAGLEKHKKAYKPS